MRLSLLSTLALALGACTMTSVHQTPDVLPEGFSQLTVETGAAYVDGLAFGESMMPWSLSYRSNVGEHSEAGFKYGNPGGFYVDVKHELITEGSTLLSIGALAGTMQLEGPAGFGTIPVYLGWQLEDAMLYAALRPALIGERFAYFSDRDDVFYGGGTVAIGLRQGRRSGLYFELAYARTVGRHYAPTDAGEVQSIYVSVAPFYNMRPFTPQRDPWHGR